MINPVRVDWAVAASYYKRGPCNDLLMSRDSYLRSEIGCAFLEVKRIPNDIEAYLECTAEEYSYFFEKVRFQIFGKQLREQDSESFKIAKNDVYKSPIGLTKEPSTITQDYKDNAERIGKTTHRARRREAGKAAERRIQIEWNERTSNAHAWAVQLDDRHRGIDDLYSCHDRACLSKIKG